jgi:O-antigen ligase
LLNHGDSEGRGAFVAVVVFTFILLLAPQAWIPALAPLRIAFLAAGTAAAFLLWDRWKRGGPLLNANREVMVAAALPAWALLTLPLSYWPSGSMTVLSDLYLKALAIFWLLANVVTTAQRLRLVATSLILCTIPLAATALKNFIAGKFLAPGDAVERIIGYQNALGTNPNDLALILNLVMPLGIAIFLSTARPFVRVLCLVVIAFDVLGVILTFSRAGFLGLATIGLVYFAKLVRRPGSDRSWAFALLLVAMLFLSLMPANYVHRVATLTDIETDPTGSAQARWRDNVAAIQFVIKHPIIGAGIGMDVLALNEVRGPRWSQVHNVYFQYAVDLGLPGLILFLILLCGVFGAARSSRRRTASMPALRNLFLLNEGLEVSLIVFAVAGLFHPAAYHFYFYYIAGLALAAQCATDSAISATKASGDVDCDPAVLHVDADGRRFLAHELT